MAEQLSFPLPVLEALGRDDFFVSPANAEAVAMIEGWQCWPSRKLVLIGPRGAGKTHLAHVWAALSNAQIIAADHLADANIPALALGHVAVEDADKIAGTRRKEDALFHLHNLTLAEGNSLLLTATTPANRWPLALPDLASRVQGTPYTTLREPDDALLTAVLMKLMADRQLSPSPSVLSYLTRRIDRSFEAARDVVERLDAMALSSGRPITRALAAKLLDNPDA
ncbi:DnaA/Hda family protein [Roseovarius sp. MMSF_3281]|uniref:DnaA/Hda family protein n=1 Tax=Roseovarius sp. MMSF_3281 TaxID=3046694 RepID=UPI00273E929E|nr:DnaA/Hda family protein [Roseovarius sp. MMSF_3281]